ncbi:dynein axonemal assembly factor 4-like [Anthonomus grandis grandis]|uniref:dynein axonemal assembly factor 4-like n=1 Tax=Anthonomus grandis grandis TaxID=2921223 RepID=UPI0021664D78|nr:dynein axonemal assembly factor 4-like [Anthonomus grandis grandis]
MPIIIQDLTWKQTEDRVVIQVPLHGVPQTRVDLFTSPRYIKASFESFFFDAVLREEVDVSQSTCTKSPTCILFDLKKCSQNTWETLEVTDLTKKEKNALKQKLIEEEHERIKKRDEERKSKKAELKRVAINEQIELDTRVRTEIEEIKKAEETRALGDLENWKSSMEQTRKIKPKIVELEEQSKQPDKPPKVMLQEKEKSGKNKRNNLKEVTKVALPKPRNTRALQILFTPREFPTPSRESRLDEENDFLAKQAEARRSAGFVDADLRPEEKNPQYLLAKGKQFLKAQNYLGAISALSFGIKLAPKFIDLYIARSEVQIIVGNYNRAIEDCTEALNLLKPALPVNKEDRALCLGRRGEALFKLGFLKQGISELEASNKLNKCNEFEKLLAEFKAEMAEAELKQEENFNKKVES